METATKAQIFARYLGQKAIAPGFEVKTNLHILSDWNWEQHGIALILKPLSAITDQDAIEIGRIYYSTITNELYPSVYELKKEGEIIVNGLFKRNALSCIITVQVFQYLQCRGYALPQTVIENGKPVTYTVDQLVETGVFKLMDGKEETK